MLEGLNTAAAGMAAQQQRLDAVANDLANANTTGYKHGRVGFRDLVYTQAGRSRAQGVRTGAGAAAVDIGRGVRPGRAAAAPTSRSTSRSRARLPAGHACPTAAPALTRDGNLHVDAQRPPRHLHRRPRPADDHDPRAASRGRRSSIGTDGTVAADGRRVGRLDVVTVRSPQAPRVRRRQRLRRHRRLRQRRPPRPPPPRSTQGALEASNVDVSDAMVAMIESQRAYQLASKAIQTADQMMEIANGVKR